MVPDDDELYVRTQLDDLVDELAADRLASDLTFLTGDAGDGETAPCAQASPKCLSLRRGTTRGGVRCKRSKERCAVDDRRLR